MENTCTLTITFDISRTSGKNRKGFSNKITAAMRDMQPVKFGDLFDLAGIEFYITELSATGNVENSHFDIAMTENQTPQIDLNHSTVNHD